MKRIIVTTLLLAASISALAQTSSLTVPPKKKYKYDGKIVSSFDKERNVTIVGLALMDAEGVMDPSPLSEDSVNHPRRWDSLSFSFGFSYPGTTLVTPSTVTVAIHYEALEPQKYEEHELSVRLDGGERRSLGRMTIVNQKRMIHKYADKPYAYRFLQMSVPYEELLKMANAKKINLQLGKFDFDLNSDQREAIKDLASRTIP